MKPVHLLLVEDNEGDILLTQEAFEEAKLINKLSIAKDGEEAIHFLKKEGAYVSADTPDLILLDINLPKINGHEVLKFIKSDDRFKHLPVIMLTTSSSPKDILQAYKEHTNCFITKPVEIDQFLEVVKEIEQFWISIVKLPA